MFDDDVRLVNTFVEEFAGWDVNWSLDVDGMYSVDQALCMGKVLDEAGWEFFEAPLPDGDLDGYKTLADALHLVVICGGNNLPNQQLIEFALKIGAWDRSRFDVTGIGGFTGAGEVVAPTACPRKTCKCRAGLHADAAAKPAPQCYAFGLRLLRAANAVENTSSARDRSFAGAEASSARAHWLTGSLDGLGADRPFVYARRVIST